jgi:Family of unknown function (DUF6152)
MKFIRRLQASSASALILSACVLSGAAVSAHHGTSLYAMDKEVVFTGIIKEWRWLSPHTWLDLTVTTVNGRVEEWNLESAPPGYLARQGWSETTLAPGEKVSVTISLLKAPEGSRAGILLEVARANGEVLMVRPPGSFGRMKR